MTYENANWLYKKAMISIRKQTGKEGKGTKNSIS